MFEKLERILSKRWARASVILASLLCVGASLDTGLGADDHIHRLVLRGSNALTGFARSPLDLFRFATADSNRVQMNDGVFPWWADASARLAFFRPVSSLTHWLDQALWAASPLMMHLHSIAWFALALFGLVALYSRLVKPGWVATLALFFYALDDARGAPIAWIANRNAIVACALSLWALVLFIRSREPQKKLAAFIAPLVFGAALLASEGAIAVLAYLAAYQLFLSPGSRRERALALVPYAGVTLAVLGTARALGYGVVGSGVYIDPLSEPVQFTLRAAERLPILLLGQLAGPWSDVYNAAPLLLPALSAVFLGLAVLVIGGLGVLVAPLWKRDPTLRFWIVGGVLSALPSCATFPSDRLLGWVAIGASPVLAHLFAALLDELRAAAAMTFRRRAVAGTAIAIAVIHGVIAPLVLPMRSRGITAVREMLARADDSVPRSADVLDKTVVYVNPPADPFASYVPILRAEAGVPRPQAQRWLATGSTDVTVERVDAHTLRVRPDGGFLASPSEQMLRSPSRPLGVGEKVSLSGMDATVTALTEDGRPAEALVRFEATLEDPHLVWLRWEGDGYVPFKPPAVGESAVVPKVNFFEVAYGKRTVGSLRSALALVEPSRESAAE